jgi:hypothetical protein
MAERNYLVHNPQVDFDVACTLCRKTAIQDTIVAGVAGSLPPAAFYTGPPAPPASLSRRNLGTSGLPTPSAAPTAPAGLTEALTTESISLIQTQLSTQATAQEVVNRSLEDKIANLSNQIGSGSNRDRTRQWRPSDTSGPRSPPVVCTFCNRHGHSIDNCYTKERADRAAGSLLATPTAYMTDTKVLEEPKPLVYHHAFLAAASTPPALIPASIPVEDRAPS